MQENENEKTVVPTDRQDSDSLQKDKLDEFFSRTQPETEADRIAQGKQKRQLVVPGNSQHKLFSWVGAGSFIGGITVGLIIVWIMSKTL